jgi:hypothetical protein
MRGLPSFHLAPRAEDSIRRAKDLPRDLKNNWFVNVSTGDVAVRIVSPDAVLSNPAPGKFLDFTVNVACGLLRFVEPSKVISGITLPIYVNLSPSPMSIGEDSMYEFIADPSSSYPSSWLYRY